MKKILLIAFFIFACMFSNAQSVYLYDACGTERIVNYGSTYVYVEVDGEWMKTRLYSTMCPTCGHYFDCWHRHYRSSIYTIPSYATVGLYWYFVRPLYAPTIYYKRYPVYAHYSYPVYLNYYRVHHHYPAHHVYHSKPAPKHYDSHKPAPKPKPHHQDINRTYQPRSTVNTRTTQPVRSTNPTVKSAQRPQSSSRSVVKSTPSSRPSSSSSVRSGGPSNSTRTSSTRR